MRANAGYIFIVELLVEGIRIETGLLHHRLHQRLLLHHIKFVTTQNFSQQIGFCQAERGDIVLNHACIIGILNFLL